MNSIQAAKNILDRLGILDDTRDRSATRLLADALEAAHELGRRQEWAACILSVEGCVKDQVPKTREEQLVEWGMRCALREIVARPWDKTAHH